MVASAAMCFLIAYERYDSAVKTAKRIAEALESTYESVRIPEVTLVCGTVGIALLVSGVLCYREYRKQLKLEA